MNWLQLRWTTIVLFWWFDLLLKLKDTLLLVFDEILEIETLFIKVVGSLVHVLKTLFFDNLNALLLGKLFGFDMWGFLGVGEIVGWYILGWLWLGDGEEGGMLWVYFLRGWRAAVGVSFETRLEIVVALREQDVFTVEHSVFYLQFFLCFFDLIELQSHCW